MYCAFWAIISGMILSLVRRQTRASLGDWIKGLTNGAIAGSQIAMAMGCVGILLRVLIVTGLAVRFPSAVEMWSGGSLVIAVYTRSASTLEAEAGERAIAEVSRTLYDYFLFSEE